MNIWRIGNKDWYHTQPCLLRTWTVNYDGYYTFFIHRYFTKLSLTTLVGSKISSVSAAAHAGLQISTCIPDKSARAQIGLIMKSASLWELFRIFEAPCAHIYQTCCRPYVSTTQFISVLQSDKWKAINIKQMCIYCGNTESQYDFQKIPWC